MEYKVLIRLFVPEIEDIYEVYVPINKPIGEVTVMLSRLLNDLSDGVYPVRESAHLYNRRTGSPYSRNQLVRNSDIRNGTELVIIG